jgi:hypothetical protein
VQIRVHSWKNATGDESLVYRAAPDEIGLAGFIRRDGAARRSISGSGEADEQA